MIIISFLLLISLRIRARIHPQNLFVGRISPETLIESRQPMILTDNMVSMFTIFSIFLYLLIFKILNIIIGTVGRSMSLCGSEDSGCTWKVWKCLF